MTHLTFYGHSCFSVEIAGKTLLIDSFPDIVINHENAKKAFSEKGVTLHLPAIGDTLQLNSSH